MEDNGMDTVFSVYDPYLKTKFYLLYDWEVAEYRKVSKWSQTLTITGVGYRKGDCLPICNFGCDNLSWSEKCVLASITINPWGTNEKYLDYDASGLKFSCAIF